MNTLILARAEKLASSDPGKDVGATQDKAKIAEEKLTRLEASFSYSEAEVFSAISTLFKDTSALSQYHGVALSIMQVCEGNHVGWLRTRYRNKRRKCTDTVYRAALSIVHELIKSNV